MTVDDMARTEEVGVPRRGRPRVAVAYDITSSSPMALAQAMADRCEIVWVVDTGDPELGSLGRLLPRLGEVVECGGRPAHQVVADLARAGVSGVVAFTDSQLAWAGILSQELGLPGNPPHAVRALTDKVVQRQCLHSAGIDGPRFERLPVGTTLDQVAEVARSIGYPVVCKPVHGTASRNVVRAAGRAELSAALSVVLPGVGGLPEEYIVEQWLEGEETDRTGAFGPYVSVEAMAQEGRVTPLAITGKFPTAPICRETGNFMPHHLDPDLAGRVLALAVDAASALGVRSGALHIEIKLTPSGPRIIEVNGRVGGGGIDDLYRAHRGQSLADIAVRIAMGERLELRPAVLEARGPVVYDYYLQPPMSASRVVRLDGLDRVDGLEGVEGTTVNRTVGDRVDWRVGSQGYVLSVRGRAADHAGVAQAPGLIDAALDVTYASE